MGIKISADDMSSEVTRHTAKRIDDGWAVSWLPGRVLTQNESITAMTIAEVIGGHDVIGDPLHAGHRLWPHLDSWAAELGMSGPQALAEASLSPEDHEVPRGEWPSASD
jgi:hypothetical protein